ncbi:unnamed protein product, partial [Prorocentrum cordatum]
WSLRSGVRTNPAQSEDVSSPGRGPGLALRIRAAGRPGRGGGPGGQHRHFRPPRNVPLLPSDLCDARQTAKEPAKERPTNPTGRRRTPPPDLAARTLGQ